MTSNSSGLKMAGHRVLVLPEVVEEKSAGGIIINTGSQQAREEMAQMDGVIIDVGPSAWSDQQEPWAKVGDRVVFAKYSGLVRKGKDEKIYRIINDLDVVAVLEV